MACSCYCSTSIVLSQDRANQLFKQVHDQKSLRGRSNDAIASACLYIACRQDGVPRTFKGCLSSFPIHVTLLRYKLINSLLKNLLIH